MVTRIYLVRHGKVDYIPDDYSRPLSKQGIEDVKKLAENFRDIKVTKVLSSPYLRAVNTVKGIAENRGLEIETIENLRERKVAHNHIDDFKTFIENQWNDFDYHLDGGESLNIVQKRGVGEILSILDRYSGEDIVIGSHGTFLSVVLNYFDKKHDYEFWKSVKSPDVYLLTFKDKELLNIENIQF